MAREPKDDEDPLYLDDLAKRLAESEAEDDSATSKDDSSPETLKEKPTLPEVPGDEEGGAEGLAPPQNGVQS
jgi:hypothetical protein